MTHAEEPENAATARMLFEVMVRIRKFEEMAGELMANNRLAGSLHLSIGQEAVAAGVCSLLSPEDLIASTHRGHGHCIAKGGDVGRMMAELFGKPEGYCRGRSGSMHIADPQSGILGANAIVAGGLPMALGAALTAQINSSGKVVVAFFGEGAVAQGVFHECMNLASLWKLPIIFACENNQYAELTHVSTHLSARHVSDFAPAYGVPASRLGGNDVWAVRRASGAAILRARRGEGPSLLEFDTYRMRGHFEGDPQRYRDVREVEAWGERDPIISLRTELKGRFGMESEAVDRLETDIELEVSAAVDWAEALPDPTPSTLLEDIYRAVGS